MNIVFLGIFVSTHIMQAQIISDESAKQNRIRAIYEVTNSENILSDTTAYSIYNIDYRIVEDYSSFDAYLDKYEYTDVGLLQIKKRFDPIYSKKPSIIWKYAYDNNNQLIREISKWHNSQGKDLTEYSYDDKGQIIEEREYNNLNEVFKSIAYTYYNNGELKEKKYFEKYYKPGNKIETFDRCGNKIGVNIYGRQQPINIQWEFDSFCTELEETVLRIDTIEYNIDLDKFTKYIITESEDKIEYYFDSDGNLTQFSILDYGYDGTLGTYKHEFFNSSGQLIEYKELSNVGAKCIFGLKEAMKENKKYLVHKVYEYQANGLLYKIIWYDSGGNVENTKIYTYK